MKWVSPTPRYATAPSTRPPLLFLSSICIAAVSDVVVAVVVLKSMTECTGWGRHRGGTDDHMMKQADSPGMETNRNSNLIQRSCFPCFPGLGILYRYTYSRTRHPRPDPGKFIMNFVIVISWRFYWSRMIQFSKSGIRYKLRRRWSSETGQGTRVETVQLWEEFMWHGVETFEPDALFLYSSLIKSSLIIFDGETKQPLVLVLVSLLNNRLTGLLSLTVAKKDHFLFYLVPS